MTKSLTEQWKDGELHFGFYYVKFPNEEPQIYSSEYLKSFTVVKDAEKIKVLAPVPTYEDFLIHRDYCRDHQKLLVENMNLKEQLEYAIKIIDDLLPF